MFRREAARTPWTRSLTLAGAGLTGVWLLSFLRCPANPPGVGDQGRSTPGPTPCSRPRPLV
ncbi:hypothetical protein [Streptomyces sp. NPDC005799]|uniref:hypothetical protein n=1 Tax=Streptomyces sp. NPDC005799 TaxID=3154678 RepID=UPI00340A7B73